MVFFPGYGTPFKKKKYPSRGGPVMYSAHDPVWIPELHIAQFLHKKIENGILKF
jgi:hypothetical protein